MDTSEHAPPDEPILDDPGAPEPIVATDDVVVPQDAPEAEPAEDG